MGRLRVRNNTQTWNTVVKKCVLFCFPRTGSNLAMQLLKNYQRKKYSIQPLPIQEFFAFYNSNNDYIFNRVQRSFKTFIQTSQRLQPDEYSTELTYRLMSYEKMYTDVYPIPKLIYPWTEESVIDRFVSWDFDLIYLDRRSKLDNFLSYHLATNSYFHVGRMADVPEPQPSAVSRDDYLRWKNLRGIFDAKAETLNFAHTVYYEDFVHQPRKLFELLGIEDSNTVLPSLDFIATQQLHHKNKLHYAQNSNQVMEWLRADGYL